jgi:hypothetical protein
MFHRNWNWMIGVCSLCRHEFKGDGLAAKCARSDITGPSNRKEPFAFTY